MTPQTWIIVADSARARVYSLKGRPRNLMPIREMAHPESRMYARELATDRPGRVFESVGQARSAVSPQISLKTVERRKFSLELANMLDLSRKEGLVSKIIIVAGPAFLGDLRNDLTQQTSKLVELEIPKDLVNLSIKDLKEHLPQELFE